MTNTPAVESDVRTELNAAIEKNAPFINAGDLPNQRTSDMVLEALASEDIETVKAELKHTWLHYAALELFIAAVARNPEQLVEYVGQVLEVESIEDATSEDAVLATSRLLLTDIIQAGYRSAHGAMDYLFDDDKTVVDAVQAVFPQLNYEATPRKEPSMQDMLNEFLLSLGIDPSDIDEPGEDATEDDDSAK